LRLIAPAGGLEGGGLKAVIMAGGEGSRLRPLTADRPKPMVPVANLPAMEHTLLLLKKHGIREVVATVWYEARVIQDYFRDGQDFDMKLHYAVEDRPLGTAGSVRQAREILDEPFLVISGDAVTDIDLTRVTDFHRERGADATLTLYRVANPLEYGVVITADDGRLLRFQEKPTWGEVLSDTINTGIYVIEPEVMDLVPEGEPFDFANDLFPILLRDGRPLYGYVADGYWTDVGNVEEYRRANVDAVNGETGIELPARRAGGALAAPGAEVAPGARIFGRVLLGRESRVRDGAVINGPTVIGDNTVVESGARIDQSIVWANSYVGRGARLQSCVVGRQCIIHADARIAEGAVIGDGSAVGPGADIRPGVKLWPNKQIDAGAVVTASLVYGSQARRTVFGPHGVDGLANVEMTPEFAATVGAGLGSVLRPGSLVVANRDVSHPARMVKRAVMAGLTSAGMMVLDIGASPSAVAGRWVRREEAAAGFHVRLSPNRRGAIEIAMLGPDGAGLSPRLERSIETVMAREDFRRVSPEEIGQIRVVGPGDDYVAGLEGEIDLDAMRGSPLSVVIDYSGGAALDLLPGILARADFEHVAMSGSHTGLDVWKSDEKQAEELDRLSRITASIGADIGLRLDMDGRTVRAIDETGRELRDVELAGVLLGLVAAARPGARLCLSLEVPLAISRHLEAAGAEVVWGGTDQPALLRAATAREAAAGADGRGGFCFPGFHPNFDGLLAALKLAEGLVVSGSRLSAVVAKLPEAAVARDEVACPWERRAALLRELNAPRRGRHGDVPEGLVFGDVAAGERVVITPLADRGAIGIATEAATADRAEALLAEWRAVVADGVGEERPAEEGL
jgi:mannose-1-phosphate guanylyltransferase / phosphomannomutase